MFRYSRCLWLVVPLALTAGCNRSSSESPASATTAALATTAPVTAATTPAPTGTSATVVATPLPIPLSWNNLPSQVGKYQNQIDLFRQGPVSVELRKLLGDKLAVLERNLQVAGPLQKQDGVYYLVGNAPHQGGAESAYVLIDPAQKAVEVGLWQSGKFSTWKTPDSNIVKPGDVKRMIRNARDTPAAASSGPPPVAAVPG